MQVIKTRKKKIAEFIDVFIITDAKAPANPKIQLTIKNALALF